MLLCGDLLMKNVIDETKTKKLLSILLTLSAVVWLASCSAKQDYEASQNMQDPPSGEIDESTGQPEWLQEALSVQNHIREKEEFTGIYSTFFEEYHSALVMDESALTCCFYAEKLPITESKVMENVEIDLSAYAFLYDNDRDEPECFFLHNAFYDAEKERLYLLFVSLSASLTEGMYYGVLVEIPETDTKNYQITELRAEYAEAVWYYDPVKFDNRICFQSKEEPFCINVDTKELEFFPQEYEEMQRLLNAEFLNPDSGKTENADAHIGNCYIMFMTDENTVFSWDYGNEVESTKIYFMYQNGELYDWYY